MDSARSKHARRRPIVEVLETRELLSTIEVTTLRPNGAGSLRQAIVTSNSSPGPDTIDFAVSGMIRTGRRPLPAITGTVNIDGTSAPGFAGTPVVTVNFVGSRGLRFALGSDGSTLRSLSLVKAGGAGVTLAASNITVQGNDIGLMANGSTVAGNRGDGIRILASSHGDLIGQVNPVTNVSYFDTASITDSNSNPITVSGWQGIRDGFSPGQYLITGTSGSQGLLYVGPINGVGGTAYYVNYPKAQSTSVYGPDLVAGDVIRLVGSYKTGDGTVQGFMFQGTLSDLSNQDNYRTIDRANSNITYVHSTAGDLAVGNGGDITPDTDGAFLYSISKNAYTDIVYPGSATTSAYGIWHNGGTSYTICGGFSMPGDAGRTFQGYLVDYDAATGRFSHWTAYAAPEGVGGVSTATHFQGISSPVQGIYTLGANVTDATSSTPFQAALATVRRNPDGSFSPAYYVNLNYTNSSGVSASGMCTADSVAGNQVVGIASVGGSIISYQATVNLADRTSNVIGGNRGNGIGIYGASNNRIAMNNIGTDVTGMLNRGNRKDGILLTRGASGNLIGGTVSGGNDPTGGVFVRPPQGNLISGNRDNGVRLTGGAHGNTMSGNFVGTNVTGDAPLGNRGDGVAIVRADGNALIGCKMQDQPFVYYNVLSGNGGNGLRITNSNDTTVQANFLGAGANNATVVPNHRDGLLVSGHSQNTQVGGVIPLGNVISGNTRNGIEVTQRASGFTSFNTFAGTFAFSGAAPNGRDGILVTSRGGNNLIRTCIVSGNLGNGIELGGGATGVQVTETAVGTNSAINAGISNGGDGIKIDGRAHGNAIGGFQPSIEPDVTVSSNLGFGIEVSGHARGNSIFHAKVGSSALGTIPLGNAMGGIALGRGTSSTTIGGAPLPFAVDILYNAGSGVSMLSSRNNTVVGTRILSNAAYGVIAVGNCQGSVIRGSTIAANGLGNVNITRARGVTYIA